MYRHKFDSKGSAEIGQSAADLFEKEALKRGWLVTKATREQDYKEHWDYQLRTKEEVCYIEVKGMKRLNRNLKQDDKLVCIELQGNSGYPGWLYGRSTKIAFLMKEGFIIVDRKELVNKIETLIDIDGDIKPSIPRKQPHIIYRRVKYNHKDKIVYITKGELLSVPHEIWEI